MSLIFATAHSPICSLLITQTAGTAVMFVIWNHSFSDYMLSICCLGQWQVSVSKMMKMIHLLTIKFKPQVARLHKYVIFVLMLDSIIIENIYTTFKK